MAFTFNTTDELSHSYWLQYAKNAVNACDTGSAPEATGFFGADDAGKTADAARRRGSPAEDVVKVYTY